VIHPTAVISPEAEIGSNVEVGPHVIVGPGVKIGARTKLIGSCVLMGPMTIGEGNEIHPFAVLGGTPQDRTYAGEPTTLTIGDHNVFREHVTVHRGTVKDRGETRIGHGGLFMASSHVAHDCVLGDGVTLVNGVLLGGHVKVGDGAVLGGQALVAPFVRIGRLAFVAGGARVETDAPPFLITAGDRARVRALNRVGLQRAGVECGSVENVDRAFRLLFRSSNTRASALKLAEKEPWASDPLAAELIEFLRSTSK
jgi:UDP-N-acetylglucosamine acyltransferase